MMAKSRHHAPRDIPEIPFAAPAGTPAGVEVMSLGELRRRASEHTLARPQRPGFHHVFTLTTGDLRHVVDFDGYALRPGSWLWVRPGQVHQWGDLTRAEGTLILFQQDVLDPAMATAAGAAAGTRSGRPRRPTQPGGRAAARQQHGNATSLHRCFGCA